MDTHCYPGTNFRGGCYYQWILSVSYGYDVFIIINVSYLITDNSLIPI